MVSGFKVRFLTLLRKDEGGVAYHARYPLRERNDKGLWQQGQSCCNPIHNQTHGYRNRGNNCLRMSEIKHADWK